MPENGTPTVGHVIAHCTVCLKAVFGLETELKYHNIGKSSGASSPKRAPLLNLPFRDAAGVSSIIHISETTPLNPMTLDGGEGAHEFVDCLIDSHLTIAHSSLSRRSRAEGEGGCTRVTYARP